MIQIDRKGKETSKLMNIPDESKYCCLLNDFQFLAAYSFIFSAQYTTASITKNRLICNFIKFLVTMLIKNKNMCNRTNPCSHRSVQSICKDEIFMLAT